MAKREPQYSQPERSGEYRRFILLGDGREMFSIQAFGYLNEIKIMPNKDLPNMNAATPYRLSISLTDGMGEKVPFDVMAICEAVK